MVQHICKSCGHHFKGNFCNECGEKVYTDHDKSMSHFIHETFHFFTHLDNKFFKTIVLLFRSPGTLSYAYCNGIRKKYFNPFSLFFIAVIIYLIFPLLKGLNPTFNNSFGMLNNGSMGYLEELANHKAAARNISISELAARYDQKSPAFAKPLLLIILPLAGLVLKVLFPKKRKYFFDYLVLGTESSGFMFYLLIFILPLILFLISLISGIFNTQYNLGDLIIVPLYAVFSIFWSVKAFMRFFEISFIHALSKGFLFLLFQSVIIIIIYRLILFLTVLLFI